MKIAPDSKARMTEIRTVFSDVPIDRCSGLRSTPVALASAMAQQDTRFIPVWRDRCLVHNEHAVLVTQDEAESHYGTLKSPIFLGRQNRRYLFTAAVSDVPGKSDSPPVSTAGEFVGLRELSTRLPETEASVLAYARAMTSWQQNHLYCGVCGQINKSEEGGFVMACSDVGCSHRCFPRLDPAIIVLVKRDRYCLLGRQQRWTDGHFSTIAGFVEPGESLEDAVRREVAEETNIRVGHCRYLASQPWPFPSALMLGFHADALSENIHLNDAELAEARWIDRNQIAAGVVTLPPATSVAYRLIEIWFNEAPDGPPLANLNL